MKKLDSGHQVFGAMKDIHFRNLNKKIKQGLYIVNLTENIVHCR
jgi:hypothetical protein